MIGQVLEGHYEVMHELRETREGKLYHILEDRQDENKRKMLKGIALLGPREENDAILERDTLQELEMDFFFLENLKIENLS
ncbi:Oidioi.mRNA.OKI2018_I69.chr2.g4537.t1.cds [Oikopleura dioica]|uniref:Oidioi.mRNA.OKI2018_I69.chr2.g4537.t1.cds n=1 Tax=Oikopleura dioica TaxID=34765 RepID=A0ABN7SX83_OIKDI|nr:Oidioi.mRNA.OKI2018_I69.chr2.g4537.t1.cds [Oikopleura dioica]